MKKIAIIGHFGEKEKYCDGQTVKTMNLTNLLTDCSDVSIMRVDTDYVRSSKLKLLFHTLKAVIACEHIFLLVSVNGMKFYLPFFHYLNKVIRRNVYHYVIGSELLDMVKTNPKLVKYLNSLTANWFEYDSGTEYLRSQGVVNVSTLSNFKVLSPVKDPVPYNQNSGVFRFCTFSRVMEEKGITDAIEAVSAINHEQGRICATLDIYGQVEPRYQSKLNELLSTNPDCVAYKGVIDSRKSVDIIKDYYALLFPTKWAGEGFPGTLVDAFAAGIPIIASDWNANKEIVHNNEQGIIYPSDKAQTLKEAIEYSLRETRTMAEMRKKSREAFERYAPDVVLQVILKTMNEND